MLHFQLDNGPTSYIIVCSDLPKKGLRIYEGETMGSKSKFVRCGFNGGTEQESGRQRHALKRCLASVIAVSLSIVCMVPAAYAQDVDDVNGSSNSVILGGG